MTTILNHPPAEDLGCFIEGTLDDEARAAVVEHLADCDDCRITVVEAVEFVDPAAFEKDLVVKPRPAGGRWWVAAAAAIAIAVGGVWLVDAQRDPLASLKKAHLNARLVAARLNDFPYASRPRVNRGPGEPPDSESRQLAVKAEEVSRRSGDDPRMLHARGVALLLLTQESLAEVTENTEQDKADRETLRGDRNRAIAMLESAAAGAPDNESYQTDLAGALIATGETANVNRALKICDRVLSHNKRSLDALFNRAIAFEGVDTNEAIAAYKAYQLVDSSSPWATEANERLKTLSEER